MDDGPIKTLLGEAETLSGEGNKLMEEARLSDLEATEKYRGAFLKYKEAFLKYKGANDSPDGWPQATTQGLTVIRCHITLSTIMLSLSKSSDYYTTGTEGEIQAKKQELFKCNNRYKTLIAGGDLLNFAINKISLLRISPLFRKFLNETITSLKQLVNAGVIDYDSTALAGIIVILTEATEATDYETKSEIQGGLVDGQGARHGAQVIDHLTGHDFFFSGNVEKVNGIVAEPEQDPRIASVENVTSFYSHVDTTDTYIEESQDAAKQLPMFTTQARENYEILKIAIGTTEQGRPWISHDWGFLMAGEKFAETDLGQQWSNSLTFYRPDSKEKLTVPVTKRGVQEEFLPATEGMLQIGRSRKGYHKGPDSKDELEYIDGIDVREMLHDDIVEIVAVAGTDIDGEKVDKTILEYGKVTIGAKNGKLMKGNFVGKGGFGVVIKYTMNKSGQFRRGQEVVLKKILRGNSTETRDNCIMMFLNEVAALKVGSLNTKSEYGISTEGFFPKYYDCYVDKEFVYICMDYIDGRELHELITSADEASDVIDPLMSVLYTAQLSVALAYLHKNNYIYKDIKSENVIVKNSHLGNWEVVLLDYGLAEFNDPAKVHAARRETPDTSLYDCCLKVASGTLLYMSPEIIEIPPLFGFSSDWWSLGILIYEMFIGRNPFGGLTQGETLRNIARVDPFESLARHPPEECAPFMQLLLTKSKVKRMYASLDDNRQYMLNWTHAHAPSTAYSSSDVDVVMNPTGNEEGKEKNERRWYGLPYLKAGESGLKMAKKTKSGWFLRGIDNDFRFEGENKAKIKSVIGHRLKAIDETDVTRGDTNIRKLLVEKSKSKSVTLTFDEPTPSSTQFFNYYCEKKGITLKQFWKGIFTLDPILLKIETEGSTKGATEGATKGETEEATGGATGWETGAQGGGSLFSKRKISHSKKRNKKRKTKKTKKTKKRKTKKTKKRKSRKTKKRKSRKTKKRMKRTLKF